MQYETWRRLCFKFVNENEYLKKNNIYYDGTTKYLPITENRIARTPKLIKNVGGNSNGNSNGNDINSSNQTVDIGIIL